MAIYLLAGQPSRTNLGLVDAWHRLGLDATLLKPAQARWRVQAVDTIVARLDVTASLDGVEPGLRELRRLERRGLRVFNTAASLRSMHDKLETAVALSRHSVPSPSTAQITEYDVTLPIEPPVVIKPRFGSWGRDVVRCDTAEDYMQHLDELGGCAWFRRHGALVQELVEPLGFDMRLLVSRGEVVGAIERVAAPGEWRTNVALGAIRRRVTPPPEAVAAALAAAAAIGGDFVGVDLLPRPGGGYVVLELNGAVDFTAAYALDGQDVFERVAMLLAREEADASTAVPRGLHAPALPVIEALGGPGGPAGIEYAG
jgi:RimK family alpha-L-glutamate ligase